MSISKQEARELMSRGYEMGATVVEGAVQRQADGTWAVGDRSIKDVLDALDGEEVVIVVATVQEGGGKKRLCRACGSEYEGYECPRCREIRQRLRGRT